MAVVWNASIQPAGYNVSHTGIQFFQLELIASVDYPPIIQELLDEDSDEDDGSSSIRNSKVTRSNTNKRARALSTADHEISSRPSKKLARAGGDAYVTTFESSVLETTYMVVKMTCQLSPEKKMRWIQSSTFQIDVEDKSFSSGKTKNAYMLRIRGDQSTYTGKRFYNIGRDQSLHHVSNAENDENLRKELVVAYYAGQCLHRFNLVKEQKRVFTSKIRVADPFMLTVANGYQKGLSWIVDPFLGHSTVTKYSGTDIAGCNTGMDGMTCDAFAHFSLHDSAGNLVFVDIQGMKFTPTLTGGGIGRTEIVLFDLMAHSNTGAGDLGLGDLGPKGIHNFCAQHKCNRICAALGLDPIQVDTADSLMVDKAPNSSGNTEDGVDGNIYQSCHQASAGSEESGNAPVDLQVGALQTCRDPHTINSTGEALGEELD